MDIQGQTVLVTGGSRGLGRAFAQALAKAGMNVAITARSAPGLMETAKLIEEAGGQVLAVPADVTDPAAIDNVLRQTEQKWGAVDLLINNAGVAQALGAVGDVDANAWWRDIEINVRGPFLCTQAVLPRMIASGRGRIINVASGAGLNAIPGMSAYCLGKAALIRLTENIDVEFKQQGITAFAIHPGAVQTSMVVDFMESPHGQDLAPGLYAYFQELSRQKQFTPIESPVHLVLRLASGEADALSGCYIAVYDDLDELIRQAAPIQQEGRRRLRLAA
jgi:NAD(P)-dependent dehydrogenase (short-subunit alcohol dehydrogenase family)